jgi:hypothetical protein
LDDPDLFENLADVICEKKKLPKSQIPQISQNIQKNWNLIHLDLQTLPKVVVEKMTNVYEYR